jgi:hypothetical protein
MLYHTPVFATYFLNQKMDSNGLTINSLDNVQPNVVVEFLTLLLGIQKVLGSNLGPETGYPE